MVLTDLGSYSIFSREFQKTWFLKAGGTFFPFSKRRVNIPLHLKTLKLYFLLKDLSCFGSPFGNDPNTELKQLNLFGQVTKPTKIT